MIESPPVRAAVLEAGARVFRGRDVSPENDDRPKLE